MRTIIILITVVILIVGAVLIFFFKDENEHFLSVLNIFKKKKHSEPARHVIDTRYFQE